MPDDLRILVVDDDFRVAAMHAKIVDAMVGLTTAGSARTLSEARAILERDRVDLALVDVYLPDGSGIDLVREMRCDAFILGAADDAASVRAGLAAGALQYLIKPFATTELARRLGAYTAYRRILGTGEVTQDQVDAAASVLRSERPAPRRDEGGSVTERRIVEALRTADGPMLADDIAGEVGVSPATARRYLAELVRDGTLTMALQYGATGRPRQRYTLS
ncbi:Transcriptional regulatory protein CitT (plasmid) [Tsukamurella tyrosinosolvens]|jgi:two-component system, CitB family, response regulator|uniref:Transcriptional regulatory protein n=1 Tax=Tsukamurella tyrosinosolvens TaxID=57704 RepID=A0A1H4QI30_TSUTY|nr:response regulator [Tsukamurella tyrosinosolvens]AUN39905.1 response regulator [Tsukamurella tyrosinosolvens]KXO91553.1 response regulator receiver protein [Tsukamurella tyrosinosolvens]MEC4614632.1 response regulator [Tsukamurella tyrosinosolvens]QRY82629.1 response regulator [Tsukamurella tyrosinosolvens]RDB45995.1 response regulator [Tsukamurella tyrosinosolvens]